jgi:hypothetical protein
VGNRRAEWRVITIPGSAVEIEAPPVSDRGVDGEPGERRDFFLAATSLAQNPGDVHDLEVEHDLPAAGCQRFGDELIEHTRQDPSRRDGPRRCLRHIVVPTGSDVDTRERSSAGSPGPETNPVRVSQIVTTERTRIGGNGNDRFDRRPVRVGRLGVHRPCHARDASAGRLARVRKQFESSRLD